MLRIFGGILTVIYLVVVDDDRARSRSSKGPVHVSQEV